MKLDPDEKLHEQDSIILNSTLTLPKTKNELPTKKFVNKKFNDPCVIKYTAHVDFNDEYLDDVIFGKVNNMPAVREDFTRKNYVDQAIFYHVN